MSRDYQPIKNNPYYLPRPLYKMSLAFIRDHHRMKEEYKAICEMSPPPADGLPRGSATGNPTERLGIRRMELSNAIDAVEAALQAIPEEYRKGVYANIVLFQRYPDDANPRTYRRYKAKFVYKVAEKMFWV
jgi:hypothetical protein